MSYQHNDPTNNKSGSFAILHQEDEVPSNDDERNLALLPVLMYIALMIVIGTAGNSIVCYVYGYKLKLTVTKQFILVLAILDLANCLLCAPTEMVIVFKIVSFDEPAWCKISRFLTYSLNGSTSLILLAIAVDRYCKVCKPLRICFNRERARNFCIVAICVAIFMSWPSLVLYGTKTVTVGVNGTTCLIQDSYEDTWYPFVFYTIFFILFLSIATTIIVLYAIIAVQIRKLRKRQDERISNSPVHRRISGFVESQETSDINIPEGHRSVYLTDGNSNDNCLKPPSPRTSANANKIANALLKELHKRKTAYKPGKSTLMLFIITILFMLSFVPFFITAMVRGAQRENFLSSLSNTTVVVFNIFIRSYLLSNAANPIIYSFCNTRFRRECKMIFCRCLKKSPVEIRVEHTENTQSML